MENLVPKGQAFCFQFGNTSYVFQDGKILKDSDSGLGPEESEPVKKAACDAFEKIIKSYAIRNFRELNGFTRDVNQALDTVTLGSAAPSPFESVNNTLQGVYIALVGTKTDNFTWRAINDADRKRLLSNGFLYKIKSGRSWTTAGFVTHYYFYGPYDFTEFYRGGLSQTGTIGQPHFVTQLNAYQATRNSISMPFDQAYSGIIQDMRSWRAPQLDEAIRFIGNLTQPLRDALGDVLGDYAQGNGNLTARNETYNQALGGEANVDTRVLVEEVMTEYD